jgi:branched-chain amino acid aminotransferase
VENVFLVKGGKLWTNDEDSSILMGITRASILELAADLGIASEIRALRVEDMLSADEAFFTGTALEIAPIRELDGRPIGSGRPGPMTLKLRGAYLDAVAGRNPKRRAWITLVRKGGHVKVA